MQKTFLTAEWRKLAMANFAVDGAILKKYLPYKTEIDTWRNTCYLSLVGFMFLNTKVMGFKIPFHTDFEEVNLRFYVRYNDGQVWKRGVVFIKEIVPRMALTFVANTVYKENYETMEMKHSLLTGGDSLHVAYQWRKHDWNSLSIQAKPEQVNIEDGSEEEFITEHFWGYTYVNQRKTSEYGVEHPRWMVYPVQDYSIHVNFEKVYGEDFGFLQSEKPTSVFLAEGSEIIVKGGTYL